MNAFGTKLSQAPKRGTSAQSRDLTSFERLKCLLRDADITRSINRRADQFTLKMGRRPRILLCGTVSNDVDSVDNLVPAAFSQWGFDVDIHPGGQPNGQTARAAVENDVHAVMFPFNFDLIEPSVTQLVEAVAVESGGKILRAAWKQAFEGVEDNYQANGFDEILSIGPEILAGLSRLLARFEEGRQPLPDLKQCFDGITAGNRAVIAKAITLIESTIPGHQQAADQLIGKLLPLSGNALRIGISGVPGAGKSTFIESFGMMLADRGHRVAVLTVDPSSAKTGGSVLGDKTRMKRLSGHPNAFIRPTASGGSLGGIAKKTRESIIICDAAGFDVVLVETVGVGQSESSVASMVDFFMVLLIADAGDEFQGIKKGILELCDAIVINKADGENIERAREAQKVYESALSITMIDSPVWTIPVLTCSSLSSEGVADIWKTISDYRSKMDSCGEFEKKRRRQYIDWMWERVEAGLKKRFYQQPDMQVRILEITEAVKKGRISPTSAALELLDFHC